MSPGETDTELTELGVSGHTDPIRVLHVDDDESITTLTKTFLERVTDQLEVTTRAAVEAGMQVLADQRIDCVVSDYDMPGNNGLDFLKLVRDESPNLPFILFTGKGSEEIASDAISAGVTDYLQKGGGSDQYTVLANRIENAVGKHRAERRVHRGFQAMESAQEGIGILNEDGEYSYLNPTYGEIYGTEPQKLLGVHWETVYPDDEVERFKTEIIPKLERDGVWNGHSTSRSKDGERIAEELTVTQLDDGGYVCTVRDVSEQKRREEERRQQKQFLNLALDSLDDIFYAFDTDLNFLQWNRRLETVTGHTTAELESITPLDLFDRDERGEIERLIEEITENEEKRTIKAVVSTKDGEEIPYEISGAPIESDGAIIGICGVGRKLSEDS